MSPIRYLGVAKLPSYLRGTHAPGKSGQGPVALQGFRVVTVTGDAGGLVAELAPDLRFSPRCGQCGERGWYRGHPPGTALSPCAPVGDRGGASLCAAARELFSVRRRACRVDALGQWETADDPRVDGDARNVGPGLALAAGRAAVPVLVGHRGHGTAVEEAVAYGLAHRDLDHVTHIGIDEISRKRGHVYVTNVYDLERKRLVWSGEGRSTETFQAFFDVLGPEKTAALEGICCDMWQPYIDVIKARAPQAVLVFDKFHIVRHLMEAVDQVRRDEIREKGPAHKALMYKTRFIWLKNPWNLTESQARRLGALERLNLKINRAYLLKRALPELLGVPAGGLGEAVPHALVLVGDAFAARPDARLRVAVASPRRRHPQLSFGCPSTTAPSKD